MIVGKIYAEWCGACQSFEPLWQQLKNKYGGKHQFHEYNQGDSNERYITIGKYTVEYQGFPTIFKIDNNKVHTFVGNRDEDTFKLWLEPSSRKKSKKRKKGGKKSKKRNRK